MTIDDIKTYLRVDHDDDDNLINQLEKTADAYLAAAVTDYSSHYENDENFKASADMAKLAIIAELYENRNEAKQDDYSFTIRSMITQLQYWE